MKGWSDITTAPKDGTIIRISGVRFEDPRRYYADAMWDTRHCPAECTDWFPPEPDDQGPYLNVDRWKPTERKHLN